MKKTIAILFLMFISPVFAETIVTPVEDWQIVLPEQANYKLYYSAKLKTSKWRGYPDPNYSWDGKQLSYERAVKDENGKYKLVKTYHDPIELIANFKPETAVFGVAGNIERAAVKKFGGALRGFVWLDNASGGGEVVLPFTAPHIFIARGDRLNPELTEIGTDPNATNYYKIVGGRTHVFVKNFSGVGGAAGSPATLIAWYKMNEDTVGDNAELVTNGDFATWTVPGTPDGWVVTGESGNDPEIDEAATGEKHSDTPTLGGGMCNLYTSNGTNVYIARNVTTVIGRKYRLSINIDTIASGSGGVKFYDLPTVVNWAITTTGTHTTTFVATATSFVLVVMRNNSSGVTDVTFDDVSIKLCAAEDSSGNDHDGLLQEDTDAAHVAGKINGAFDFDGSGDYIKIADHDDFTPALTPFSISAWVYMHDATYFAIASKGIFGSTFEWRFVVYDDDKLQFRMQDDTEGSYIGLKSGDTLTTYEDQWIYIVATSDGSTVSSGIKLYLNGLRVSDADYSAGSFASVRNLTGSTYIGRYTTTYANGLIDNVMFFSTDLDIDEVEALYNHGAGTEIIAEIDERRSRRRY